jgi:hypothetical protein
MKWWHNNLNKEIGGKERHREVLPLVAPLLTILVGS